MRLTCPNCGARYEVEDSMIPPEGRDVQCSNCSTTWFQPGSRTLAEEAEPEPVAAEAEDDASEAVAEASAEASAEEESAEIAAEAETAEDTPQRRELDPAVRDLLREEAEREAELRRLAAESVETQEEMPLEEAEAPPPESSEPLDADENFDTGPEEASGSSRRDLLPDIEEINSTLRATSDRSPEEDEATDIETIELGPRRRRGVRMGFGFVLALAVILVGLYLNAGRIAEQVPQVAGALQAYVDGVNALRFWLDDLAQGIIQEGAEGGPTE